MERPGQLPRVPLAGSATPRKDAGISYKDTSVPHPFDGPFAIMKSLQGELKELRIELKTEKQQRSTETKRLEDEVMMLHSALAKDRTERIAACEALGKSVATEAVRTEKAIQALHSETYGHLHERTRASEFQALQLRVLELSRELDNETRAREQHCGVLDNMIAANYAADKSFSQRTLNELSIANDQIERNNLSDFHIHDTVVPKLVTAGHLLRSGAFNASVGTGVAAYGSAPARHPFDTTAPQESTQGAAPPASSISTSNMGALSRKLAQDSRDEMLGSGGSTYAGAMPPAAQAAPPSIRTEKGIHGWQPVDVPATHGSSMSLAAPAVRPSIRTDRSPRGSPARSSLDPPGSLSRKLAEKNDSDDIELESPRRSLANAAVDKPMIKKSREDDGGLSTKLAEKSSEPELHNPRRSVANADVDKPMRRKTRDEDGGGLSIKLAEKSSEPELHTPRRSVANADVDRPMRRKSRDEDGGGGESSFRIGGRRG